MPETVVVSTEYSEDEMTAPLRYTVPHRRRGAQHAAGDVAVRAHRVVDIGERHLHGIAHDLRYRAPHVIDEEAREIRCRESLRRHQRLERAAVDVDHLELQHVVAALERLHQAAALVHDLHERAVLAVDARDQVEVDQLVAPCERRGRTDRARDRRAGDRGAA
jgi:hypothetical protein